MLWKHTAPFHIYQIHDALLGRCRAILIGTIPNRCIQEARNFLEGKGLLYLEEEYSYVRLFGYEEVPLLFPKFVIDKLFISEVCMQYLFWSTFFEKKHKR